MNRSFLAICLLLIAHIPPPVYAATITAGAGCSIRALTPNGSADEYCDGFSGTPESFVGRKSETIEFATHSAQAGYGVSIADYGHLGGLVTTYAQNINQPWGYGLDANSSVGLQFSDYISVVSSTLPYGSPVSLRLDYRVDGDFGANTGDPGYYPQNASARLRGGVTLDHYYPGSVPVSYSTYCVVTSGGGGPDCLWPNLRTGTFEVTHDELATVLVGVTYHLSAYMNLEATTVLDLFYACPDGFCDAGAYLDSSHSFFTYLTPESNDFQITSESGHNYSMSAVPEPPTGVLAYVGLSAMLLLRSRHHRRQRADRLAKSS